MKRFKIFSGILLVFIVGAMTGILGTGLLIKSRFEKFSKSHEPPMFRVFKRFSDRLDLTEIQKDKIEMILEDSKGKMIAFRKKYQPEYQKLFDDTNHKIKEELTVEQQQKFEKFIKRIKKHAFRPHRPPPHRMRNHH